MPNLISSVLNPMDKSAMVMDPAINVTKRPQSLSVLVTRVGPEMSVLVATMRSLARTKSPELFAWVEANANVENVFVTKISRGNFAKKMLVMINIANPFCPV